MRGVPRTGEPNELVAQIHPRMPAILPQATSRGLAWRNGGWKLKREISPRVNSPKNDDPSLWEPLHAEPAQTTTDALELLPE